VAAAAAPRGARRRPWLRRVLLGLALLAALAGGAAVLVPASAWDRLGVAHWWPGSSARQLAEAHRLIGAQQRRAAVLVLKSLLQSQPELAEARWLLGSSLLALGDGAAAEAELQRALALGHPRAQVVPVLARAQLLQGRHDQLVQAWGHATLTDAAAQADLDAVLAQAEAMRGELPRARSLVTALLNRQPQHLGAQLLQVRLEAGAGDTALAQQRLDAVLAVQPQSAEAWTVQGDLATLRDEPARATEAYRRALAAEPGQVRAHGALITALLARREIDAARAQHAAMRRALPDHPQTWLFDGRIAFETGDFSRANEVFQRLLKGAPDHLLLLQSAGATALRLKMPAQAERHLARALQLAPDLRSTRRLLAQTQLELGQPERALATLEPMLQGDAPDATALTLAGQARLLAGDLAGAEAQFRRAAALVPDDARLRTTLALSHAWRGQPERSLVELQQVAAGDSGVSADLALLAGQLRRRAWPEAQAVIEGIERKQPGQALPVLLRGQLALARGDRIGAREAFDEALRRRPADLSAATALARLDLIDLKPEAATARLDALVQAQPQSLPVRLAQADIVRRAGAAPEAVAELLEAAVKLAPSDRSARQALIDHHRVHRQAARALEAAQAAAAALPDDPEVLVRLGQAQRAAGAQQQALATFGRLLVLQPKAAAGYQGLAETQLAARDDEAAARTLQRGLENAPSPALERLAVGVALRRQAPDQALALARQVQARRPQEAAGWLLEADVAVARQQAPALQAALREAVARQQPGVAPQRLHLALLGAGRAAEAQAFAEDWLRRQPEDLLFRFHLGEQARLKQDLATAERHYQAVIDRQPDHGLALNNLAWVLLQQQRPGALALAERAVQALPGQPAALDTLAAALASHGRWTPAKQALERALALAPADAGLKAHLARIEARQPPLGAAAQPQSTSGASSRL